MDVAKLTQAVDNQGMDAHRFIRAVRDPLFAIIAAHVALTFYVAWARLSMPLSFAADMGLFVQALESFIGQGVPTVTLAPPFEQTPWLGFHFSPLVLAIAPIYALIPEPETLLAVQSLFLGLAAWPIRACCRALGAGERESLVWACCYLVSPFVTGAALWDFHEQAFAAPLMALGLLACLRKRRGLLLLACLGLALTKEHYGLAVAGFGLLWALRCREWRFGLLLAAAGLALLAALLLWLMPGLSPYGTHAMLSGDGENFRRYAWLSEDWARMPQALFRTIASAASLTYLAALLAPFAAALGAGLWLLPAAADLAANLLATHSLPKSLMSYHSVALIPVLAVAACAGARRLTRARTAVIPAAALSLALGWLFSPLPLPFAANPWQLDWRPPARDPAIAEIREMLGGELRVSAQVNIGGFFADRRYVYPFPEVRTASQVDAIVLHFGAPQREMTRGAFSAPYGVTPHAYVTGVEAVLGDPRWTIVHWHKPWLVMQRGGRDGAPREAVLREWRALREMLTRQD